MVIERAKRVIGHAAGNLGSQLLLGGRRIRQIAEAKLAQITDFEEQLQTLSSAAANEGVLDSFAMRIRLGNGLLDYAVASRLRDPNSRHRLDLTQGFEAYEVNLAVAYPLKDYDGLWLRRMDGGFSGRGLKFDILGEDNLYVFDPQPYRPGNNLLV